MSKTSERIRHARKHCRLTTKQLTYFIGVSERSVVRYENDQSTPDTHSLIQLASIFDLSTDYLLGLSDNAEASFLELYRTKNIFYRYVQNNHIREETDYYWIEYSPKDGPFPLRGKMQWAGTDGKEELYALRPIIPESCLIILEKLGRQKPLILNSREDFNVFLIYGGTAFASHQVCKECMPYLLRPGTVKNKAREL
ncbi:HTH-type transcriptional regulator immR [Anaerotruncus sp. 2789STDY5834896]|uniref:HTH-type transcriptional regulator immR n=1 Tax=uncultured Anaerotruncus sp. TaxID=905011 RepID=A0A1C6JJP4_9FIRM|nr:HTH-type transcriptional regulator immR [uncultured Anaerotruncus sp.]